MHTAGEYGIQAHILEASLAVNRMQRGIVIQKPQEKLYILKGRWRCWDSRSSPTPTICATLPASRSPKNSSRWERACAPTIRSPWMPAASSTRNCGWCIATMRPRADALVLVTEWPEFASLNLRDLAGRMNNPVPVDGRNVFRADRAREAGFDYTGIGRALPRVSIPKDAKRPAVS